MISSAPTEKDTGAATLEKSLKDGAAQAVPARKYCARATATRGSAKAKLAKPDRRSVGKAELHYLWIQLFFSGLNGKGWAGFVMANRARNGHSCSMNNTKDFRKYATEQGLHEDEMLKMGMEANSKEFAFKSVEVYEKA